MRFEEILVLITVIALLIVAYDFFILKKIRQRRAQTKKPSAIEFVYSIFPVLCLVLVIRTFIAEPFRIPSTSMKPTLLIGDFVLVNKYSYGLKLPISGTTILPVGSPKRGDVIVFRHDGHQDLIKRIVGMPGDHISYKNKVLYVNGVGVPVEGLGIKEDDDEKVYEKQETLDNKSHRMYITLYKEDMEGDYNDTVVPTGTYFVLGDNRDNSRDSRFWGFVASDRIIGKAVATWWSWDWSKEGIKIRWNRVIKRIN